jgi:hypothetical protein
MASMESDDRVAIYKVNFGWQRRLKITVLASIIVGALVIAFLVFADRARKPQIVYPPGWPIATLESSRPISAELLRLLEKQYGLDSCTRGKKYGALCQDGETSFDVSDDACADHGGVKAWVECR